MRTTLDIDDPVLDAVKELAARYGFRPFPATAIDDRVTNEQVNRLHDDLGIWS